MKTPEKQAYRISEFCSSYGISRSKAYQEMAAGKLKAFKVGRATLISKNDAQAWINLYKN